MIVEHGPINDRRLDRWFSAVMRFIQRRFIGTAVHLDALRPFAKRRPPESLIRQLRALGLDADRIEWSPFTIKPEKLAFLIELIEKKPPRCVLELGSGVTTVVLAALAEKHGFELLSLENYPGAVDRLYRMSGGLKCARHIRVQQCQFRLKRPDNGRRYYWFNADLDAYGKRFDFVVIDAPMARLIGRRGALPEIEPYLDEGHRIVLDDSNRRHERECLAEWSRQYPNLNVRHYKQCPDIAILRLNKTVPRAAQKAAAA